MLLLAAVAAEAVLALPAKAQVACNANETCRNVGNVAPEPAAHHSFVRHLSGNTITSDAQYAKDIRNNFTGGSVDVLMDQCHGGGFLGDIRGLAIPHTFASAAAWNECSADYVVPAGQPRAQNVTFLENFARSWRKSADLFPTFGMLNNFRIAADDGVVTVPANADPKDRFAPPGANGVVEHPQYQSSDRPVMNPDGSIGGPNNVRTLTPPNGANEYAILVEWGEPTSPGATRDTFAVNIARMNKTVMSLNGAPVPLRNIVVLYGTTVRGTNLGPFNAIRADGDPNGENLGTFFVDDPNSRQNWVDALAGRLFVNNNNQLGINYGPNDQLFIYNTGHGGAEDVAAPPVAIRNGLQFNIQLADNFEVNIPDPSLAEIVTDPDGTDLLQISTTNLITDPAVELMLDGVDLGPLAPLLVTDLSQVLSLGDFVPTPTFTYQLRVPQSLLATNPAAAEIELLNLGSLASDQDLVAAFDFQGGEQEFIAAISVPEAGSATLFGAGLVLLFIGRQRRGSAITCPG
jgi:hypothetical protein